METGELVTYDNVRRASWLSMLAGGDFIKTSTGKISPAATLPVTLIMLEAVRDWRETTGEQVGVKPAGGIRTTKDAIKYLVAVNEIAGEDWLDTDWFRFGASSLLNDLLLQRQKMRTGAYSGADYVPTTPPASTDRDRDRAPRIEEREPCPPSSTPRHPSPGPSSTSRAATACSSAAQFVEATGGAPFKTINPATEEVLAEVSEASDADVDAAVTAARTAYTRVWSRMSGAERGKYLFRIARILQERAREFAVLETLDNGKPIKEARDVDVPLAAAHFFYHAGWADKLDHACLGPEPAPARRRRPDHPVELPAAHARVEDRAGAGGGQHRRAQAGRDDAADRPALRRGLPAGRPAARASSTSSPAPAPPARRIVDHPGVDKLAFTGSTAVGKMIARSIAGTRKKADPRAGRQGGEHHLRRRPHRPGRRGHRQRHLLQPGPRLLRRVSRLLVQENIADERRTHRLKRRLADPARRRPAGQEHRRRRDQLARAARPHRASWSAVGEAEGAERWTPACDLPTNGFWFRPTVFTGVSQTHRIAQEEIFGPVAVGADLPHPGQEAVAKANNTPYGLSAGVWTEKG